MERSAKKYDNKADLITWLVPTLRLNKQLFLTCDKKHATVTNFT